MRAQGSKRVIILCFDFKNRVENSQALQTKIKEASDKYGFRVLGLIHSDLSSRVSTSTQASILKYLRRGISLFIAQSTTLSSALLDWAASKNIGFSYFISVGTKIDIKLADLIDFLGLIRNTGLLFFT